MNLDEDILLEIKDEDIEWDSELHEVYIEKGTEYYLDDLVNDFYTFCCYMFARAGFDKPTTIQRMIIDFIAMPSDKYKMIQAPRGAGKSYISQLKVLWDILRNNDVHILVRSASDKRSRNYTTYLLNLIKTTPLLQHLAPKGNQRKSTELFDVDGAMPSDSPTVLSETVAGTVTGLRATLIVLDDVEVLKNSSSANTRDTLNQQVLENFNLLAETTDADGNKLTGTVLVLGTFQSSDSIYVPMIRSGAYDTLIIPAEYPPLNEWYVEFVHKSILDISKDNPDMIGRAIDERLNDDFLAKKRMLSKTNYELHYMLNPNLTDQLKYPLKLKDLIIYDIDPIDNPIRFIYSSQERVKNLKHKGFSSDYFVSPAFTSEERMPFQFTTLAIDPSGRGTDETGWIVVSLMGGKIFVRDFGGLAGGYDDDSLDTLVGLAIKYKVNKIKVESNFGDGAYLKMLEKKLIGVYNCATEDSRATAQKEARIIDMLEPLMNQHRIIVDRSALDRDFEAPTAMSLTYQMTHLTKQRGSLVHDDRIDVWELGIKDLVEYMANGENSAVNRFEEDRQKKIIELYKNGLFPELARGQNITSNYGSNY